MDLVKAFIPVLPSYDQMRARKSAAVRRLMDVWERCVTCKLLMWVFDNMQRKFWTYTASAKKKT